MAGFLKVDTLWLISSNVLLGLAILLCLGALSVSLIKDLRHRSRQRKDKASVPKDLLSGLKDLGVDVPDQQHEIDELEHQDEGL